jgi:AAHS family 4-hydroxybenzoate transporter-like MFS transporter
LTPKLTTDAATINVQQIIDRQDFGRFHWFVTAICAVAVLMDGFDAQVMGFVAPAIAGDLHIARGALGPILVAGQVGMLIGALIFGPLADRVGRKRVLLFCTLWFGVGSLLTARADSISSLLILRLITGLGLGGTLPNAIALTSEYMPRRLRATGVMLTFAGFSIGAAAGGFAAAGLIARFGWRSVFVTGGVLPCVTAAVLLWLPESIRFLVLKGGQGEAIARLLRKVAPSVPISPGTSFVSAEHRAEGFVVRHLFTEGRTGMTLLLWVIYFMSLLDLFFLTGWLPTILHDAKFSIRQAILVTTMLQVGGTVAALILGRLIDRASHKVVGWTYLGAVAGVFLIGAVTSSVALEAIAVFAAGFCVVGAQTATNSLAAHCYPTAIRSTGSGWAMGMGRIGSIAGPMLGGLLLSSNFAIERVFWVAAAPPLIAALAAFVVSPRSEPT